MLVCGWVLVRPGGSRTITLKLFVMLNDCVLMAHGLVSVTTVELAVLVAVVPVAVQVVLAATVELAGGELDVDTATDLAEATRLFR